MNETVIIHGDYDARNADFLMRRFGCIDVVHEWDGFTPLKGGQIALTRLSPKQFTRTHGSYVFSYDQAMAPRRFMNAEQVGCLLVAVSTGVMFWVLQGIVTW